MRLGLRLHLHIGRAARFGRLIPLGAVRELDLTLDHGDISLRLRSNDVAVIEIMGLDAYGVDLALLGNVKTVFDIGANIGVTSVYLARRLPDARFVCVEASPSSFALLEENLSRNVPRASALNLALVAEPGSFRVIEGSYSGITRVDPDRGQSGTRIPGMTLSQLCEQSGFDTVDLLKLDIEGGEGGVFDRAADWAARVRTILAEVHPPLTVAAAESRLAAYGYRSLPLPNSPKFADILFVGRSL